MANKPVSIEFIADVAKYLREVKKMEVSTEDVADALVATTNSADDLERKLSRAMKDSAKDTEVLERALKDIPKASGHMADDVKRDFDKVGDAGAEAGKETAQEFKQNLGESLSSGDLTAILQDTAGGLVSGLSGPLAWAAAALAGVAAIGFSKLQEQAEQAAQLADTYLGQMRERLGMIQADIDKAFKTQQMQEFVRENLDFFQSLNDELAEAGINANDYVTALYEGGQPLADMEAKLRANRDLHKEIVTQGDRTKVVYDDVGDSLDTLINGLGTLKKTQQDANQEARTWDAIFGHSADTIKNLKTDLANIAKAPPITVKVQQQMIDAYKTTTPYGVGGGYSTYNNKPGASG
jgi:hypothetical protein